MSEGENLFNEIKDNIKKYYFFENEESYDLLALFVLQCYVTKKLHSVFYIFMPGTKGAGKTSLLHVLVKLCEGFFAGNTTAAALKRSLPKEGGRMIAIDEYEGYTSDIDMMALQKIARQGYKQGETIDFCAGPSHKVLHANPFGPKIIAFRGDMNDDALIQRGFGLPANRFDGSDGLKYVLRNWNVLFGDLTERIKDEGEKLSEFDIDAYAHEDNQEFLDELKSTGIIIGANRETEICTIALVVAKIWGLKEISKSLKLIMNTKIVAEKDTEDIAELADIIIEIEKSRPEKNGKKRFTNKELKKAFDERTGGRPSTSSRFASVRRELGVRDAWSVFPQGALMIEIPTGFIENIKDKYGFR